MFLTLALHRHPMPAFNPFGFICAETGHQLDRAHQPVGHPRTEVSLNDDAGLWWLLEIGHRFQRIHYLFSHQNHRGVPKQTETDNKVLVSVCSVTDLASLINKGGVILRKKKTTLNTSN